MDSAITEIKNDIHYYHRRLNAMMGDLRILTSKVEELEKEDSPADKQYQELMAKMNTFLYHDTQYRLAGFMLGRDLFNLYRMQSAKGSGEEFAVTSEYAWFGDYPVYPHPDNGIIAGVFIAGYEEEHSDN